MFNNNLKSQKEREMLLSLILLPQILTLIQIIVHLTVSITAEEGEGESYLDWCEEAEERKRVTIDQCTDLSFVYPFPLCFCLKGAITMRVEGAETPKLILGDNGCFNQKEYGTINRTMRLEPVVVNRNNYLVAIPSSDGTSHKFYSYRADQNNPMMIFTNVSYQVFNGDVIDLLQEFEGTPILCVQLTEDHEKIYLVKNYALTTFPQVYLLLNKTCDGGSSLDDTDMVSSFPLYDAENNQCRPICPPLEEKARQSQFLTRISLPKSFKEKSLHQDPMEHNLVKFCKEIPAPLRSLHEDLNRRMMTWSIERAFSDSAPKFSFNKFEPVRSFKILDKLVKITDRYCRHAQLPRGFLHSAVELFKIAHQGRGFVFAEDFRESEYRTILKILTRCLWDIEPLKMNIEGCPQDNMWVQSVYRPGSESENDTIVPSRHHQYFDHHVVLDIPWKMIDLTMEVCVKSFSSSLRMYHIFEQKLEALFTADLRQFWLYPEIQPLAYVHLLGPNWMSVTRNLEKCVAAAYKFNGQMSRLNRPTWVSGVNTKRGTNISPICERKRTDVPLISATHEIYCTPQFPPAGRLSGEINHLGLLVDRNDDTYLDWSDKLQN